MQKKLIIMQEEISDCGACSLLSIIRYYGYDASLEDIRYISSTTSSGITAYNLIECAKQYGFDAIGYKIEKIGINNIPCIAHLNINKSLSHFVVVYKVSDSYLEIMDPAQGKIKINIEDFYKIFTGNVIFIKPNHVLIPREKKIFNQKIHSNLKNNKKVIFLIIVLYVVFIILSIIYSFYINYLTTFSKKELIILIFLIIAIIRVFISYKIEINMENIDYNISKSIIPDFFKHLFKLPLKYIHMKSTGDILKRVEDLELVKNLYSRVIITLILNSLIIISIIVLCLSIKMCVFLTFLWLFIFFVLLTIILNKSTNELINNTITNSINYNSCIVDSLKGITSIYHSNSKEFFQEKIKLLLDEYLISSKKFNIHLDKKNLAKNTLIIIAELILNTLLIIEVSNNNIAIEYIVIVNLLFNLFITSLNELFDIIPTIYYQRNIVRRINEFYNLDEDDNQFNELTGNSICFKHIYFGYNGINIILKDKSFFVKSCEKVVLKGPSGSGKSTICRLITKEYSNYNGNIYIGNNNLKDVSNATILKNIAYASQNEKIFIGTIKENITLGLNPSNEKLNKIIELCKLDKVFRDKPFKLDTFLFGGGEDLSGGERQLIILARTLLRANKIIILDEILSEVDIFLEKEVMESVFKYFNDYTIIYISHKNIKLKYSREIYV